MKKEEFSEIIAGELRKRMLKEEILKLIRFTTTHLKERSLIILEELKILGVKMLRLLVILKKEF
mgnify:CR=1 FL=1